MISTFFRCFTIEQLIFVRQPLNNKIKGKTEHTYIQTYKHLHVNLLIHNNMQKHKSYIVFPFLLLLLLLPLKMFTITEITTNFNANFIC